ncbi:hypothetical protein BG004_003336 [Podila humilis]|nr:hypothetical protein BG004_003336 [Podila humilis]
MRIQWTDLKAFTSIGSGSFGRVYHGELLGTEVAIKECVRSDSRAFDEKYFKREVEILKQSRHPNIVQFMGICKRKKRFYIITEFLPLGNLRQWIQDESKEFGWDTRISFSIDISLALAYLHHKNIIHRDLKGENLLISENMRIKVCDFGFSRVEARDDDEMRRISYCGTDGYMAPEILLGEDFDCSVDVFSFGVILSEMMARHVVDSQHFQRIPPNMIVSSDEILFRSQPGCPLELGELAIHCVQFLPDHRPKLQNIVERLTAIENVDVHVGTTLLVAPSVARAARNMMRKREADAKRRHHPLNPFLDPESQLQHPSNVYRADAITQGPRHSSLIGETNSWKHLGYESEVASSQQTFKAGRQTRRELNHGSDASNIPLVLDARYQARQRQFQSSQENLTEHSPSSAEHVAFICEEGRSGFQQMVSIEPEDEQNFRMPLWDTINKSGDQGWQESDPAHVSTVDEDQNEVILQAWSRERDPVALSKQMTHETESARLSSIQLDVRDDDEEEDVFFEQGSGFLSGTSDEDDSDGSLYDDDSDNDDLAPGVAGQTNGRAGPGNGYQLSSDSDGSSVTDTDSLSESVVLALDMLEIPDHLATKLAKTERCAPTDSEESSPPVATLGPKAATSPSHSPPSSPKVKNGLFRAPSLISRLLPPIPTSENPWGTSRQSPPAVSQTPIVHTNDHSGEMPHGSSSTLIAKLAASTAQMLSANDSFGVKDPEMSQLHPPTPPSKSSSLLVRANTWKEGQRVERSLQLNELQTQLFLPAAAVNTDHDIANSPQDSTASSFDELKSFSSRSSLGSNPTSNDIENDNDDNDNESIDLSSTNLAQNLTNPTSANTTLTRSPKKPNGPRNPRPNSPSSPGLIRGMSDSFWSKSQSSAEAAMNTLASTMVTNARTWTGGTTFGTWIGGSSSSSLLSSSGNSATGPITEHNTSKRPRICIPEEETGGEEDQEGESTAGGNGIRNKQVRLDGNDDNTDTEGQHSANGIDSTISASETDGTTTTKTLTLVKKRSRRRPQLTKAISSPHLTLTGISHRFSLVAFSGLLLPKCDVCQKRIGVLPGWSSKHLECDGE